MQEENNSGEAVVEEAIAETLEPGKSDVSVDGNNSPSVQTFTLNTQRSEEQDAVDPELDEEYPGELSGQEENEGSIIDPSDEEVDAPSMDLFRAWEAASQNDLNSIVAKSKLFVTPFNLKQEEKVICFPVNKVRAAIAEVGDTVSSAHALIYLIQRYTEVRAREHLEKNENYIHPIPYIVIRKGNKVYFYARGKTGDENRLHDKTSLGFGGHVNWYDIKTEELMDNSLIPEDVHDLSEEDKIAISEAVSENKLASVSLFGTLMAAYKREFKEEVKLHSWSGNVLTDCYCLSPATNFIALDYDVHKHHIGFVYIVDLPENLDDAVVEPTQNDPIGFFDIAEETFDLLPNMEEWSRVVLRWLIDNKIHAVPREVAEEIIEFQVFTGNKKIQDQEGFAKQMLEAMQSQVTNLDELADVESLTSDSGEAVDLDAPVSEEEAAEAAVHDEEAVPLSDLGPTSNRDDAIRLLTMLAGNFGVEKGVVEEGLAVLIPTTGRFDEIISYLGEIAGFSIVDRPHDTFGAAKMVTFPRGFRVEVNGQGRVAERMVYTYGGEEYQGFYNLLHGFDKHYYRGVGTDDSILFITADEGDAEELLGQLFDSGFSYTHTVQHGAIDVISIWIPEGYQLPVSESDIELYVGVFGSPEDNVVTSDEALIDLGLIETPGTYLPADFDIMTPLLGEFVETVGADYYDFRFENEVLANHIRDFVGEMAGGIHPLTAMPISGIPPTTDVDQEVGSEGVYPIRVKVSGYTGLAEVENVVHHAHNPGDPTGSEEDAYAYNQFMVNRLHTGFVDENNKVVFIGVVVDGNEGGVEGFEQVLANSNIAFVAGTEVATGARYFYVFNPPGLTLEDLKDVGHE